MEQFKRRGFIAHDKLSWRPFPGAVELSGEIACVGRIVVAVDKLLESVSGGADPCIQTVMYSYNVSIRGRHNVFRYDNQHEHWRYPGHDDEHHCHLFDWETGDELEGSPIWIGASRWPTLGDVIAETETWYLENRHLLPDPYGVVPLDELRDFRR